MIGEVERLNGEGIHSFRVGYCIVVSGRVPEQPREVVRAAALML